MSSGRSAGEKENHSGWGCTLYRAERTDNEEELQEGGGQGAVGEDFPYGRKGG